MTRRERVAVGGALALCAVAAVILFVLRPGVRVAW
jgi:hypothetical protein